MNKDSNTVDRSASSQDGRYASPAIVNQNGRQAATTSPAPLAHDDIARCAYDIYMHSGCQQGRCRQNWLAAEQEVRSTQDELGSREHSAAVPTLSTLTHHETGTPSQSEDSRSAVLERLHDARPLRRGRNPLVDPARDQAAKALNRPL